MANEKQFKATTRIIATRGVKEYRETIPAVVRPVDHVLEVGCEWGTTTAVLARYAAHVIGTDISPKCIMRAHAMRPGLDLRVLDAFDVRSVLDLGVPITKDLSGLSGYRGLLDLIALIQAYAGTVQPETFGGEKRSAQALRPMLYTVARGRRRWPGPPALHREGRDPVMRKARWAHDDRTEEPGLEAVAIHLTQPPPATRSPFPPGRIL